MAYLVYIHTNRINGKQYVGQTCQKPESRWRGGKGYNGTYFSKAIKKYGWDNFSHDIVACDLTLDEANSMETNLIFELGTMAPNGYNTMFGGGNKKLPEQVKRKLSESHIGKCHPCSDDTKSKISKANKGRVFSKEKRANMSKGQTGKKYSDETRSKQSERLKMQWETGIRKPSGKPSKHRKMVSATDVATGVSVVFDSVSIAANSLGMRRTDISSCLSGVQKTAKGYSFKEVKNERS